MIWRMHTTCDVLIAIYTHTWETWALKMPSNKIFKLYPLWFFIPVCGYGGAIDFSDSRKCFPYIPYEISGPASANCGPGGKASQSTLKCQTIVTDVRAFQPFRVKLDISGFLELTTWTVGPFETQSSESGRLNWHCPRRHGIALSPDCDGILVAGKH